MVVTLELLKQAARRQDALESDTFGSDLWWDRSTLIDQAADVFWKQVTAVLGPYSIDRVWLERITAQRVIDGHLDEGELDWTLYLSIPGSRACKVITVPYTVTAGKIHPAKYFTTSGGALIPLNMVDLQNFLNIGRRPGWV